MMSFNLSREGYLEQRLTKGRAQIAKEQNVPYNMLLARLKNWGIGDLNEEHDLLERMRISRGLKAPTEVKEAPEEAVQPARASTRSPEPVKSTASNAISTPPQASVFGGFDLSKVKWIAPVVMRTTIPVGFNAHGLRVSGWIADKLTGVDHVQIGFINGFLVVKPTTESDGWRIKRSKKTTSCYLGSGRVLKAAQQAGFNPKAELKPEWHPQGFLIIQQVR